MGVVASCAALGVPRPSYYRQIVPKNDDPPSTPPPPNALVPAPTSGAGRALAEHERRHILDLLHSERFVDRSPAEMFHTLLDDEGVYLASVSTYYRILRENEEVKERRHQRRHPVYQRPELLATGPNQVWTWDITKLKGPQPWHWFHLYVVIDIFSRYVVGWMLACREDGTFAKQLLQTAFENQGQPAGLTIHSDNGSAMKSKPVVALHSQLDVGQSRSRPHVSNDNPYSESHFKTLKYAPGFPARFGSYEDASAFCTDFFPWYLQEHRHSGIHFLTPETVHYGLADAVLAARHIRKLEAYRTRPERFIGGPPRATELRRAVYINPPRKEDESTTSSVNGPTELSQNA